MRPLTQLRSLLVLASLVFGVASCADTDDGTLDDSPGAAEVDAADTGANSATDGAAQDSAETVDGAAQDPAEAEEPGAPAPADGDPAGDLADRLAVYLLANPDGLEIDQAQAACTGQTVAETLPSDRMELLVTNLEDLGEVEDGRQFSDEERLIIAEGFAACLDFSEAVDEVVQFEPSIAGVVECITATVSSDRVEALMLAGALGEDVAGPATSLLGEGLVVCPNEARESIAIALERFPDSGSTDELVICLDAYTDEELGAFVVDSEALAALADEVNADCLLGG